VGSWGGNTKAFISRYSWSTGLTTFSYSIENSFANQLYTQHLAEIDSENVFFSIDEIFTSNIPYAFVASLNFEENTLNYFRVYSLPATGYAVVNEKLRGVVSHDLNIYIDTIWRYKTPSFEGAFTLASFNISNGDLINMKGSESTTPISAAYKIVYD